MALVPVCGKIFPAFEFSNFSYLLIKILTDRLSQRLAVALRHLLFISDDDYRVGAAQRA